VTPRQNNQAKDASGEVDRYRKAAEDALQQLDWAIGYLHGINKTGIARALAKNRSFIRQSLMDRPEEPLPTQETDET
jgi:hypothetical protein